MRARRREEVTVEDEQESERSVVAPRDADGFAAWVSPHVGALAALAAREVGSADADDVVQEALLRAWRRRETYQPDRGTSRAWLVAIVLDQARRFRSRTRRAHPLGLSRGTTPDATAALDGRVAADVDLDRAIAHLPRRQRQVVTLYYLTGLSVDAVATVLGIAAGSVKSHLHDARTALRARLEEP